MPFYFDASEASMMGGEQENLISADKGSTATALDFATALSALRPRR
jgi:hypothetical protein